LQLKTSRRVTNYLALVRGAGNEALSPYGRYLYGDDRTLLEEFNSAHLLVSEYERDLLEMSDEVGKRYYNLWRTEAVTVKMFAMIKLLKDGNKDDYANITAAFWSQTIEDGVAELSAMQQLILQDAMRAENLRQDVNVNAILLSFGVAFSM